MILAIDIGNSNIVLGCIEGESILFEARIATECVKTADQYCVEIKSILELYKISTDSIEGTIISSVVPQLLNALRTAAEKLTGAPCMIVGPGLKTGLNIRIDNPAQAGSDLIVAAVAAQEQYGAPLIIIDMGTATTMTVLDRKGCFIGGSIHSGVRLSLNALTSGTAQLPGVSLEQPRSVIGRNTVDCIRSGAMFGTAAMLDGMIDRMEQELGYATTVVATGGLSQNIIPLCRHNIILDKNLLLKGLRLLYDRNRT